MILNGIREGCWLTPDLLGGDITNPQSLNRYAYALNNPTTNTDPLGLDGGNPLCGNLYDWPGGSYEGSAPPSNLCDLDSYPFIPPSFPIIGGIIVGGRGTGGATAPGPGAPPTGPFSGTFGGPSGFVSNTQVIEQMGVYASPWEIDVVSICVLTPGCQEAIGIAAAIGGGYLIYKGIKAGIQTHQSRGKSDPVSSLKPVNPGRDANSRCKPCPSGPGPWEVPGNAHGSTTGTHWHWIEYNQNPLTCECFPIRRSGPTAP